MKFQRRTMKADVPSVAMGDIAFNLLIFFVILARAQDDAHVQWRPARATQLEEFRNARATVTIDSEQRLHINGQQIGQAQLAEKLTQLLADAPAGERSVLLKVDKNATALFYEPAIEAISEAGGEMVHVLETKSE